MDKNTEGPLNEEAVFDEITTLTATLAQRDAEIDSLRRERDGLKADGERLTKLEAKTLLGEGAGIQVSALGGLGVDEWHGEIPLREWIDSIDDGVIDQPRKSMTDAKCIVCGADLPLTRCVSCSHRCAMAFADSLDAARQDEPK